MSRATATGGGGISAAAAAGRDKWKAHWIWAGETALIQRHPIIPATDPEVFNRFVLLRKEFELAEDPDTAIVKVAADSRCVVWINGVEIARGPVRADPWTQRSMLSAVHEELHEGRNVVAALVRYYGRPTGQWLPTAVAMGLAGGAFAAELQIDGESIGTDDTWRGIAADAWKPGRPPEGLESFFVESLDARELPVGWREPGFDDSGWGHAQILSAHNSGSHGPTGPPSDPYGPLDPSPLPDLGGERKRPRVLATARIAHTDVSSEPTGADPALQICSDLQAATWIPPHAERPAAERITTGEAGVTLIALDFGETVAGTLELQLDADAGTQLDFLLGERSALEGDGRTFTGHHAARYLGRGHHDRHETMDPMGGRFGVAALRSSGPAELSLAINERLFPRNPDSVSLRCSDPLLEKIFRMGLRTVDLCSWDAYIDCPTREARAWTGDFVVHQGVHFAASDDWSLAKWHPQLAATPRTDGMLPMAAVSNLGNGQTIATYIPDWALHWIRGVHNVMRYTGDRDLVAELLPVAERVLRWFAGYQRADGLLRSVPGWVLIDWSNLQVFDTSAPLNALWARGLRDFAEMATWLEDRGRAGWAESRRAAVAQGFEIFWDERRGLYRDQRVGGVVRPHASQHTAAAAICAGLVPPGRMGALAERIMTHPRLERAAPAVDGFESGDPQAGVAYVINGNPEPSWDPEQSLVAAQPFFRYVVHDALLEAGRADLVAAGCRDWALFVEAGEPTCPETWGAGTRCHGWSATPTRDLITMVAGIRPAQAGFASVLVEPALGDLDWIETTVPTPAGALKVHASSTELRIDSPLPVEARFAGETQLLAPGQSVLSGRSA